ncbi:MAG: (Fe-S)-binding protein [Caldilineales bacterium]
MSRSTSPIALFVTCLVDMYRPEAGEATVALLERQGLQVEFPAEQTCCGAAAWHAGWRAEATTLARRWIAIFEPYEAIVSPSPTCVAVVRNVYPTLLAGDPDWRRRAEAVAVRTYELTEYLANVVQVGYLPARFDGKVTYQPACQGLRALHTDDAARTLLAEVAGAKVVPLSDADACCGFGGLFSVQMPEISAAMAERKAKAIEGTGADVVVTNEPGCWMQLHGMLSRRGSNCRAVHLAELLAGSVERAE